MRGTRDVHGGLTLAQLWTILAVLLPAVTALAAPMSTVDLAYQVRAGQIIGATSQILRADPFTFTVAGQPWIDQQWLAQILLAGIFDIGGWGLTAIAHGVFTGLAFALLFMALRARGAGTRPAAWLTLAAFVVCLPSLAMRPQLLGVLLFALLLFLIARGGRWVWFAPAVVVVWANVHGSFVLGPATLAFAWIDEVTARPGAARRWSDALRRPMFVVAVLSAIATLLNPWGADVWRYAVGSGSNGQIARLVTEWQRTTPFTYGGFAFYVSVVVAVLAIWRFRLSLSPAHAVALAGLAVIGAYAERGAVWWAIGAPWLLVPSLAARFTTRQGDETATRARRRGARANLVLVGLVGALGVLALPWPYRSVNDEGLPLLTDAPSGLAPAIARSVPRGSRVLANQAWASWIELEAPTLLMFVDARIELFPAGVWDQYLAASAGGSETTSILDGWRIGAVVVSSRDQPGLQSRLRQLPAWAEVASDARWSVFVRRSSR